MNALIHVTSRGTSPKLDHWLGLGLYPSDIIYANLSSCSFFTMSIRVARLASCRSCCCVVFSMCVLRVVWISCVVCSKLLQRTLKPSVP